MLTAYIAALALAPQTDVREYRRTERGSGTLILGRDRLRVDEISLNFERSGRATINVRAGRNIGGEGSWVPESNSLRVVLTRFNGQNVALSGRVFLTRNREIDRVELSGNSGNDRYDLDFRQDFGGSGGSFDRPFTIDRTESGDGTLTIDRQRTSFSLARVELGRDGVARVHFFGARRFTVEGTWNVRGNSAVIDIDRNHPDLVRFNAVVEMENDRRTFRQFRAYGEWRSGRGFGRNFDASFERGRTPGGGGGGSIGGGDRPFTIDRTEGGDGTSRIDGRPNTFSRARVELGRDGVARLHFLDSPRFTVEGTWEASGNRAIMRTFSDNPEWVRFTATIEMERDRRTFTSFTATGEWRSGRGYGRTLVASFSRGRTPDDGFGGSGGSGGGILGGAFQRSERGNGTMRQGLDLVNFDNVNVNLRSNGDAEITFRTNREYVFAGRWENGRDGVVTLDMSSLRGSGAVRASGKLRRSRSGSFTEFQFTGHGSNNEALEVTFYVN